MPGRKRKPTALKVLEGTFRKDRANLNEPKPAGDLLKAPAHFNKKQQAVWDYAIDNAPKGLLKKIDLSTLEIWCVACVFYREAADAVEKHGQVCVAPSGYQQTNPYMTNMNRQAQVMLKAAAEMGFTPASRGKVSMSEEVEDNDPWKSLATH